MDLHFQFIESPVLGLEIGEAKVDHEILIILSGMILAHFGNKPAEKMSNFLPVMSL